MARPALSASRTMEILDLFAAFPGRAFTMAEIMRATRINVASCHAVLSALAARGYLARRDADKSFVLGSALIAVGQAAVVAQPLVARAQAAAHALHEELEVAVLLSTMIGDELLVLTSLADAAGRTAGIRAGQRVPLVPPAGAHFLAWASEAAIEEWIARAEPADPAIAETWRRELALVRARGFQVTLRTSVNTEFAALMAAMAAGRPPLDYRARATDIVTDTGWTLSQPEAIVAEHDYDVSLIAAPIFDDGGTATLSLGLGGFGEPLSGARIIALADRLMHVCLAVMRAARGG